MSNINSFNRNNNQLKVTYFNKFYDGTDEIPDARFNYNIYSNQTTGNDYGENYFITSDKIANQRKNESGNKRDKNKSNLPREQTHFISHSKTSNNEDNKIETSNFIESVFARKNQYIEDIEGGEEKRSIKVERDIQLKESRNIDEFVIDEPLALPLRPIIRGPFEADEQNPDDVRVVYAEPHSPIQLNCEVDLDIVTSIWLKDSQVRF